MDDLAINNNVGSYENSWVGPHHTVHMLGDGNGDLWQGSFSYVKCNERTPDQAGTYSDLNTTDEMNLQTSLSAGIPANSTIKGVAVYCQTANSFAGLTGFKLRVKSQAAGTLLESATITQASTSYYSNDDNQALINLTFWSYVDPQAGGPWTTPLLDTTQIGIKQYSGNGPATRVSAFQLAVDYVPLVTANSTIAVLTTLQGNKVETVAVESTLEGNKRSTAAINSTLEETLKSTLAVFTDLWYEARETLAMLTDLEANIASNTAVNATLEATEKSTVGILTTLSQMAMETVAMLTDLEANIASTTAVLTDLEANRRSTVAVQATLEEVKKETVAILTMLEKIGLSTTAVYAVLEANRRSTTAIYSILEANRRSTVAVKTTLEKIIKVTIAIYTILEANRRSTLAVFADLVPNTIYNKPDTYMRNKDNEMMRIKDPTYMY